MKFTRFRTGALLPCCLLALLAGGFIWVGENCAAAGLAGMIGLVAGKFSEQADADVRSGGFPELEVRDGDAE